MLKVSRHWLSELQEQHTFMCNIRIIIWYLNNRFPVENQSLVLLLVTSCS